MIFLPKFHFDQFAVALPWVIKGRRETSKRKINNYINWGHLGLTLSQNTSSTIQKLQISVKQYV